MDREYCKHIELIDNIINNNLELIESGEEIIFEMNDCILHFNADNDSIRGEINNGN